MTDSLSGPQFIQLFGPLISALKSLGGSARPAEVGDQVAADLGTSDEERSVLRKSVRDGVPPIELVDGEKLIEMLETLELGLVPVKSYRVNDSFFDAYRAY